MTSITRHVASGKPSSRGDFGRKFAHLAQTPLPSFKKLWSGYALVDTGVTVETKEIAVYIMENKSPNRPEYSCQFLVVTSNLCV